MKVEPTEFDVKVQMTKTEYNALCETLSLGCFPNPPVNEQQAQTQEAIRQFLPEELHGRVFPYLVIYHEKGG